MKSRKNRLIRASVGSGEVRAPATVRDGSADCRSAADPTRSGRRPFRRSRTRAARTTAADAAIRPAHPSTAADSSGRPSDGSATDSERSTDDRRRPMSAAEHDR